MTADISNPLIPGVVRHQPLVTLQIFFDYDRMPSAVFKARWGQHPVAVGIEQAYSELYGARPGHPAPIDMIYADAARDALEVQRLVTGGRTETTRADAAEQPDESGS